MGSNTCKKCPGHASLMSQMNTKCEWLYLALATHIYAASTRSLLLSPPSLSAMMYPGSGPSMGGTLAVGLSAVVRLTRHAHAIHSRSAGTILMHAHSRRSDFVDYLVNGRETKNLSVLFRPLIGSSISEGRGYAGKLLTTKYVVRQLFCD